MKFRTICISCFLLAAVSVAAEANVDKNLRGNDPNDSTPEGQDLNTNEPNELDTQDLDNTNNDLNQRRLVARTSTAVGTSYGGQGSAPWPGGYFRRDPAFSRLYLNFRLRNSDNHIRRMGVHPRYWRAYVDMEDNDRKEDYDFQVRGVELPAGTLYRSIHQRSKKCGYDRRYTVPNGYVPILQGFNFDFGANKDQHIDHVEVKVTNSSGRLAVTACFNDKHDDDWFNWSVYVALVPQDKVAKTGSTWYQWDDGGGDSTRFVSSVPSSTRPVVSGFMFDFTNGDQHLDLFKISLENNGYAYVNFEDKNYDDPYNWRIDYALIRD